MSKTEAAFEEMALPVCRDAGVYIYDVEYKKESKDYYLRLFIDKDGGVSIDDCERVSRALNPLLDKTDIIKDAYIFEVSSPGVDRLLKRAWHYEKALGKDVCVKLFSPIDSKKELTGTLVGANEHTFTVKIDEKEITIEKKQAASVRLAFNF